MLEDYGKRCWKYKYTTQHSMMHAFFKAVYDHVSTATTVLTFVREQRRGTRGPNTTKGYGSQRLTSALLPAQHTVRQHTNGHVSGEVWGGKRMAACLHLPTSTASSARPMRASAGRPRGRGAVAYGVVAHSAYIVPLSVAMLSVAPVSMVHAGEHDAERCRRA